MDFHHPVHDTLVGHLAADIECMDALNRTCLPPSVVERLVPGRSLISVVRKFLYPTTIFLRQRQAARGPHHSLDRSNLCLSN